jgi:MFS family permease
MGSGRRAAPLVLLESATLLSGAGNGVATVALPWLVLERTGSATAAGVIAAATALPLLISSLFAGTLVDLFGRRRVAVVSDGLSAAAVAAIPVVDLTIGLSVPVLVLLAVLGATLDPAGLTARETMVPAAAQAARWPIDRANSVHEAVWGVAFLVGPGVGGVLIAAVGPVLTLWVTAAGFLLSAVLVAAVRLAGAGAPAERPVGGLWLGTLEGLRFVWRDRLLRSIALLTMALVALYLPVEGVVLPVHFVALDAPERLGIVVMAMSAGGIAGALGYAAVGRRVRRRTVFVVALVSTGGALMGLAFLPSLWLMVVLAAATGIAYGPINPLANYAMQTRTPERMRGRVVGVMTSSAYAAGPAGYLLAGPLVEWLGVRPAFLILAGALLAVALASIGLGSLRMLDDPPLFPPAPAGSPHDSPVPLGEQWVPSARRE